MLYSSTVTSHRRRAHCPPAYPPLQHCPTSRDTCWHPRRAGWGSDLTSADAEHFCRCVSSSGINTRNIWLRKDRTGQRSFLGSQVFISSEWEANSGIEKRDKTNLLRILLIFWNVFYTELMKRLIDGKPGYEALICQLPVFHGQLFSTPVMIFYTFTWENIK